MHASTKKKRLLIIGAYGCGNRGDDAILHSIAAAFSDCDICATCGSYENIGKTVAVETTPLRLNEGFSAGVLFSMLADCSRLLRRLLSSDALMFGGGSLIHDLTPYNLPFMFLWHRLARLLGKPVFYMCMGVGPLNTEKGRKSCGKMLPLAEGLFVRDQRGLRLCRQCGANNAVLVRDAAFADRIDAGDAAVLTGLCLKRAEYICVTGSQWFSSQNFWRRGELDFSAEMDRFANCVRELHNRYRMKLVFVPTVFHDAQLGKELALRLEDIEFSVAPAELDCTEMERLIANAYLLLGVRMHSIIFAAKHAVPFVALVYDEKVRELLSALELERYCVDISDDYTDKVKALLPLVDQSREDIREALRAKSEDFAAAAGLCFSETRRTCAWE